MGWLRLALKYILYHKLKTSVLMACIFLTAFLPVAIEILLNEFETNLASRAKSTPLVVGAAGSRFDLTLRSLYFQIGNTENKNSPTICFSEVDDIEQTKWAKAIPVYSKYTANKYPVVGTTLDYFKLRGLTLQAGENLVQIGDCVVGARLARELGLKPGNKLLTDIESVISVAAYPLKMHVRGVLKENNPADDWAVFVDLKTAWIIDGIGHGHQNLENEDEEKLLSKSDDKIVSSAAVLPYTEITEKNIDSFHFHGESSDFPISCVIAVPYDKKGETILVGRYRSSQSGHQLVVPGNVINELMSLVFKVKRFFDANAILIAFSTILLLGLIVILSLKLREREMDTMFKIGASRNTVVLMQIAELGVVFFGKPFGCWCCLVVTETIFWLDYSGNVDWPIKIPKNAHSNVRQANVIGIQSPIER